MQEVGEEDSNEMTIVPDSKKRKGRSSSDRTPEIENDPGISRSKRGRTERHDWHPVLPEEIWGLIVDALTHFKRDRVTGTSFLDYELAETFVSMQRTSKMFREAVRASVGSVLSSMEIKRRCEKCLENGFGPSDYRRFRVDRIVPIASRRSEEERVDAVVAVAVVEDANSISSEEEKVDVDNDTDVAMDVILTAVWCCECWRITMCYECTARNSIKIPYFPTLTGRPCPSRCPSRSLVAYYARPVYNGVHSCSVSRQTIGTLKEYLEESRFPITSEEASTK